MIECVCSSSIITRFGRKRLGRNDSKSPPFTPFLRVSKVLPCVPSASQGAGTKRHRVIFGRREAGVPSPRGVRGMGWEADLRAERPASSAESCLLRAKALWRFGAKRQDQ